MEDADHPVWDLYQVGLEFTVDPDLPPERHVLHGALEALRVVTVEACTAEQAEAHVDQLRLALERAGNRRPPRRL